MESAGQISRDDFTVSLVHLGGSFTQQARGEHGLKHCKTKSAAGFLGENRDHLIAFLFENVGRL